MRDITMKNRDNECKNLPCKANMNDYCCKVYFVARNDEDSSLPGPLLKFLSEKILFERLEPMKLGIKSTTSRQ